MTRGIIEQEARFLVRQASVHDAIARLRSLDGFRVVSRRRERQRNAYLDTEDLSLRRAGAVLKFRDVGERTEVTFKRSLGLRKGIVRRLEVTAGIRRHQKRLLLGGRLDVAPARRVLAILNRQPLRVAFTLSTDRRILVLKSGRARVELDVDHVTFRKSGRVIASRREVEVENLTASPAIFRRAIDALRRRFGRQLAPLAMSKYEYGFRLASRFLMGRHDAARPCLPSRY